MSPRIARYIRLVKTTAHDRIRLERGYFPCPGFIGDPRPSKHKFDRWEHRPQAAWRLYWRARPELHAKLDPIPELTP